MVLTSFLLMRLIKAAVKAARQKICTLVLCGSLIFECTKNIPLGHSNSCAEQTLGLSYILLGWSQRHNSFSKFSMKIFIQYNVGRASIGQLLRSLTTDRDSKCKTYSSEQTNKSKRLGHIIHCLVIVLKLNTCEGAMSSCYSL